MTSPITGQCAPSSATVPNSTTSEGSKASSTTSSSVSNAHMPRVTLRTSEPAKLLACQSDDSRWTRWNASDGGVAHDAQRERHHRPPADMPEHDHRDAERDDREKGGERGVAAGGAERQRVDQPAGIDRHEDLGQRREAHRAGEQGGLALAAHPVAEGEAEDGAQPGLRPARFQNLGHRTIARREARVPTEMSRKARERRRRPEPRGGPRGA